MQTAVARIWRAFGLQPHRQETFKLSSDPLFVEKVRDIVGLYLYPPLKAMVLRVDEKSHPLASPGPGHEPPVVHRLLASAQHPRAAVRWSRSSISTRLMATALLLAVLQLHCYQRTLMPSEPCTEDFTLASPPMFHWWPISPQRLVVDDSARVAPAAISLAL